MNYNKIEDAMTYLNSRASKDNYSYTRSDI